MIALNLISITKLRNPEFLNCIDIYNNEYFIVIRRDQPFLIGFPVALVDKIEADLGYNERENITKREIQRGDFWKTEPGLGKIFILKEGTKQLYAFIRYTPNKTYPTVARYFKNGKLFADYLWDYTKTMLPPLETKTIMTARYLERGENNMVDRKFFDHHKEAILMRVNIPVSGDSKNAIIKGLTGEIAS